MELDIMIYSLSKEYKKDDEKQSYYYIGGDPENTAIRYFGEDSIIIKKEKIDDLDSIGMGIDRYKFVDYEIKNGVGLNTFYDCVEKREIVIKESDIPKKEIDEKIICGYQIGYQREGLNRLFYEEFKDDDYFVFDKNRLQYVYDHYIDNEDAKNHFKENILDRHVNGKTFVVFSW